MLDTDNYKIILDMDIKLFWVIYISHIFVFKSRLYFILVNFE